MKRNILLCVAGLTPQIITETMYVLAVRENVRIDEIKVITTTPGREIVQKRLFDSGKWQNFGEHYPEQLAGLKFDSDCLEIIKDADGNELPDIRSTEENESAADQICEIVKNLYAADDDEEENVKEGLPEKTDVTVYASVAGGRKTMGNYLAFAMSLFAGNNDELSHVLVDEKFERIGRPPLDFYYEPPVPAQVYDILENPVFIDEAETKPLMTDMANTTLARIPFVKLRRVLKEDYGNNPIVDEDDPIKYKDFVDKVQTELDILENEPELEILLAEKKVKISEREIELTPRDFWIYVIFAVRRVNAENDEDAAVRYEDLILEDFDNSLRMITRADDDEFGIDRIINDDDYGFLTDYVKRIDGGEVLNTDSLKNSLTVGISRLNKIFGKNKIPVRYQIKARSKTGRFSNNWIAVEPAKIKFHPPFEAE